MAIFARKSTQSVLILSCEPIQEDSGQCPLYRATKQPANLKKKETPSGQRNIRQLLDVNINTLVHVYIYICVYINMCVFFTYTHLKPGMMQGTRAVGKAPHGPKLQRPLSRIWQSARYKCNCVPSMSLGKKTSNTLSIQLTTVNATDNDSCFLCAYDNPQLRPCRT